MNKYYLLLLAAIVNFSAVNATKIRVLFIGNSYTYVNDLPARINDLALSGGDTLVYNSSAPGGYTWQQHSMDATTLSLIAQGNWNYVVLQEQSQFPSFPDAQVATDVYPYARKLDSIVHVTNPCAKTVFYMTWGRKNGDAQNCPGWPPVCTYLGMDSLLQLRYTIMANNNNALLSPVAKVWRRLRQQNPTLELYQTDESHPTEAGTFAAACTFYSLLFGKNPATLSFNYVLSATDAVTIKNAAKAVAYDSLQTWKQFDRRPVAGFSKSINGGIATFTNQSQYATRYRWAFGDGSQSTLTNPQHTYTSSNTFNVCLTAYRNCDSNTSCQNVTVTNVAVRGTANLPGVDIYPNPATNQLYINGINCPLTFYLNNISGLKIIEGKLNATDRSVSLQNIAAGLYFLQLVDETGSSKTFKLVITK